MLLKPWHHGYLIITHVNISYDTGSHNLDITRHTNNGRNTEAGTGSNENQQTAC